MMKIWFDFTNAPHINFFSAMVRELEKEHEVIITARDHSNTIDMLVLAGFSYNIVGRHYGAGYMRKIFGFIDRVFKLWRFLKNRNIDLAVSHSSFYSPLVAKSLGFPSIYLNDNEYALGNIPAFIFATLIMIPENVSLKKIFRQGARPDKILQYPGVKEAIYLQDMPGLEINRPKDLTGKKTIYIRPEPWNAQYYKGDKAFLDELIAQLIGDFEVLVLPRGKVQAEHYQRLKIPALQVVFEALPLSTIYADCDLFIGAGGTMTRELAILGVPTISVYQDDLLDVDRYLIDQGYMLHQANPSLELIRQIIDMETKNSASDLIAKGKKAKALLIHKIYELGAK